MFLDFAAVCGTMVGYAPDEKDPRRGGPALERVGDPRQGEFAARRFADRLQQAVSPVYSVLSKLRSHWKQMVLDGMSVKTNLKRLTVLEPIGYPGFYGCF